MKIKLFESKPKTNIYYEYEALTSQLTNDIKVLVLCEDLNEMITNLKSAFDEGRAKFLEESGKNYIELKFDAMGKSKKHKIELKKYEPKDAIKELNEKIEIIQNDYKNLSKDIEELKKYKNNDFDIKEKMKEMLQDKDIKMKLYEEFEKIICSKFNLTKEKREETTPETSKPINIENTVKKITQSELKTKVDEAKFNEKIKKIEEKINNESKDLNEIKSRLINLGNNYISKSSLDSEIQNNELIKNISENINAIKKNTNNNYIELKIKINNEQIGKGIKILQQFNTYKYSHNFERDDLELYIDGENSSLDIFENNKKFKEEEKSKNCNKAQIIEYNLTNAYNYYYKFITEGIHTIKIIFRKKLYDCSFLFGNCEDIIEIDLSNFDCSQVTSCESMFDGCKSLKKLNLGKLDFALCNNFAKMFSECIQIENIDVSHFNTKNSKSFEKMFNGCRKLKNIDVSKFNSSKCENIGSMFRFCENISEVDMMKWDMSHLSESFSLLNLYGIPGIGPGAALAVGVLGVGVLGIAGMLPGLYNKNNKKNNLDELKNNSLNYLFDGCHNLKKIKMSSNFANINNLIKEDENNEIFKGLPPGGTFYWKKGVNCDKLLSQLPVSWNRYTE